MKKYYCVGLMLLALVNSEAQNVAINTDGTPVSDPKALLEIKKPGYSKLKVRTSGFNDTAVIELSNRSAGGFGTDFLFSHIREQALVLSSRSDLPGNNVDSILTVSPQGNLRFRTLRGTGTRPLTANANGEILAEVEIPQTHYYSIPSSSFQPRFGSTTTNFTALDANGLASFTAGTSSFVVASVHLPHGATVTSMRVYFVDNSATDIFFSLFASGSTSFGSTPMATLTSSGASGSNSIMSNMEATSFSPAIIDNINNSYHIVAGPPGACCWDGNSLRIKSVVIRYTL